MCRKLLFRLLLICVSNAAFGQTDYLVGTSSISIEPDNSIFSVALAGYGLPRKGRFSISWKHIGNRQSIEALTGLNGKLYAATSNNELWIGEYNNEQLKWKKAGSGNKITALAGLNGQVYAINSENQLLRAKSSNDTISWKRIGMARDVLALTGLEGKLYAINGSGDILRGSPSDRSSWKKIGKAGEKGKIISLTSDDKKLYALNENDSLWSGELNGREISWIQIGRNNSLTYDINIGHLAVNDDRLFAISDEGEFYINEHSTENNLTTRVLAVKDEENTAVIVSLDLCGFEYSLAKEIKEIIQKEHNIPKSAILINATHTHFSPITQNWYALGPFYRTPNGEYLNDIVKDGVVTAIGKALENLAPSKMYFSRGNTEIGRNRRAGANPDAAYDNTLDVLRIENLTDELKHILFLTGCHPVYENSGEESYTLSGNYPAVARNFLEEEKNIKNAIFIQGLGGDINPQSKNHKETGEELSGDVLSLLDGNSQKVTGKITHFLDTIDIPIEPWSLDRVRKFKKENADLKGSLEAERNVRWADLMLERYEKGYIPSSLPVYVQTLNIGDWKFIGLSREAVNEYGPAIRNLWPDKTVSVAGYCNDVTSYLPVDWHIEAEVYEGKGSFFWYGVPGTFPVGVKDFIIEQIRSFNR